MKYNRSSKITSGVQIDQGSVITSVYFKYYGYGGREFSSSVNVFLFTFSVHNCFRHFFTYFFVLGKQFGRSINIFFCAICCA